MIPSSLIIHLEIILFTVLTNGQNNPFFICQHNANMESYDIVLNQNDQIVVANCTNSSTIAQIIDHLFATTLRGTTLNIYFDALILQQIPQLRNVTDLDLSGNNMTEIDLQQYRYLQNLNLTSNKIRSLTAIKLNRNITLASLDMSRNRLLKFEHLFIPATRKLYLRSNNIFELPSNITLPEALEELDLTRNEIENITEVVFRSDHLRGLNLSINLINAFSHTVIEHLPQLESLTLECNKIFDIEVGTFSRNVKLIELNLRDNNLSTLKKGAFENLVNLQTLDISKNNLLQLTPDTLQNLNNLMDFSISENNKLCQYACKRNLEFLLVLSGRLKTLKMHHLRLREFPITLTTSVRHLDLSQNKLNAVQLGNLENFPYLQTLTLTGNDIESVEQQVFSSMEFLLVLRLDNNRLTRVPLSLPSSLVELRLDYNHISRIEENNFNSLRNLRLLKVNSNAIQSVEPGSMSPLANLQTLDISNNPILKLSTDSWEGLRSLRTLLASDLQHICINVTDVRYFPASEMRNLRTLNLTRSPELARSFLNDLPLLATVKQLETLDLSYTNLTAIPDHLQNYLPRLKLLRLRGNPVNCSVNWFSSREYNYRELFANRTNVGFKVRVTRDRIEFPQNTRDCACTNFARWKVSGDKFWKSAKTRNPSYRLTSSFPPLPSNPTQPTVSMKTHISTSPRTLFNVKKSSSVFPTRFHVQLLHKKLNTRSLHAAHLHQNTNQTNNTALPTNFPTIEIKLPTTAAGITTTVTSTHTQLQPAELNVTFVNTTEQPTVASSSSDIQNYSVSSEAKTTSLAVSPPNNVERENSTLIPFSTGVESLSNTSLRANENDFHASTTSRHSSAKGHYESLVWNQTDDYTSFFDWFPGQNDSAIDADLAERSMKAQDTSVPYTHPGLVIFSAISCFLLVIFASVIAPPYVQKYKWRRQRYKMSQFDNECQRSIEISSISAFVETEIPLE